MEFENIVTQIYETLLTEGGNLDGLMCHIADHCGAMTASMAINHPLGGMNRAVTPRVDPHMMANYLNHWVSKDTIFQRAATMPVGHIGRLQNNEYDNFRRSALYHEGWKASGLGVERRFVNVVKKSGHLVNFAIFTDPGTEQFSTDVEDKLRVFVPHIKHAMDLVIRSRQLEIERRAVKLTGGQAGKALFVLNHGGQIAYADEQAIDLLNRISGLRVHKGVLRLLTPENDAHFQRQLQCSTKGGLDAADFTSIYWRDPRNGGLFELEVIPCVHDLGRSMLSPEDEAASCAFVIVTDHAAIQKQMLDFMQSQFELTYAESLLAVEIMKGDGRENAAKRCGIALNTARAHLRSIYAKMGVESQPQMIAKAHRRFRRYQFDAL